MENYQLIKALSGLEKAGMGGIAEMIRKETFLIPRSMPGAEIIQRAQNIINEDVGLLSQVVDKVYLTSTHNLSYLTKTIPADCQSAFAILGCGDNVCEFLAREIKKITAVDSNPLQSLIYALREASILSLSRGDYENFALKSNGKNFLSPGLFKKVQKRFTDERYQNAWSWLLKMNPLSDIKEHLLKRVENAEGSYERYRSYLYHLTKEGYAALKANIALAPAEIVTQDALAYLTNHPDKKYDYIDLTNIVSGYIADKDFFDERLAVLKSIWENNLNEGGTMTFDYQFSTDGTNYDDIMDSNLKAGLTSVAQFMEIYKNVYEYLKDNFELEEITLPKVIKSGVGKKDTVLYARKRAR